MHDKDWRVRTAVAERGNPEHLKHLMNDNELAVRRIAEKRLKDLKNE
jgi:hypothetical protein